MEVFVTVIHAIVALFIVLVVLVQGGNSGGFGAAFGGGNSQSYFGASGANALLVRLTYGAAFLFIATSLTLTLLQGQGGKTDLLEKLKDRQEQLP